MQDVFTEADFCLNVWVNTSASIEHGVFVATSGDQDFGMHLL